MEQKKIYIIQSNFWYSEVKKIKITNAEKEGALDMDGKKGKDGKMGIPPRLIITENNCDIYIYPIRQYHKGNGYGKIFEDFFIEEINDPMEGNKNLKVSLVCFLHGSDVLVKPTSHNEGVFRVDETIFGNKFPYFNNPELRAKCKKISEGKSSFFIFQHEDKDIIYTRLKEVLQGVKRLISKNKSQRDFKLIIENLDKIKQVFDKKERGKVRDKIIDELYFQKDELTTNHDEYQI